MVQWESHQTLAPSLIRCQGVQDERDAGCGLFRMAGDVQETNNIIPVMNPPNWIITVSKNRRDGGGGRLLAAGPSYTRLVSWAVQLHCLPEMTQKYLLTE